MGDEGSERRLRISLSDLEMGFDMPEDMGRNYLDLETGKVVCVPPGDGFADFDDEEAEEAGILDAEAIEEGYGTRYIALPPEDKREAYRGMEAFAAAVTDPELRSRLWDALQGRGAFRRFDDVLHSEPREENRYREFTRERFRERVLAWIEEEGIDVEVVDDRPVYQPEPDRLDPRPKMIEESLGFTRKARQLPGVLRIALIGSLVTDKAGPKDVDLLVTVADDMDLEPLAALGRKLQGRMQNISRGGEVFLADPRGAYLGRTCPWRECRPGIRMSCDALHCGRRPYLHDDLQVVKLDAALVVAPPVELWPEVKARVPVPDDLERGLLEPLRADAVKTRG